MQRNLEKRVEILIPIEDARSQSELRHLLDTQLSDQRGAWERSGRSRVTVLSIGMSYDDSGSLSGWSRHRASVKFDRDFESFTLEDAFVDIFADPAADPLNDDPAVSLPFTATARRIPAVKE